MDRRVFPTIDILKSGTRKEDLLQPPTVLNRVYLLRKLLTQLNSVEAMEFLLGKLKGTKDNQEFLDSMNS
jgi:transcription termination factor Rho